MSEKKLDRNDELVKDYLQLKKEGRPMISLVMKYQISSSRIFQILKRMGITLDNS